jgi:hypothetical protein
MYSVRGYYKPEAAFHTISEWEQIANEFLNLQKRGYDTRGGVIDDSATLVGLINKYFGYQLYVETEQYDDYTKKQVLDFIEDFVNHRVWGLKDEFEKYIVNIDNDRIAFFYSRSAIEPDILLDERFTKETYGGNDIEVETFHWTSPQGLKNIEDSIQQGFQFSVSTFTTQAKKFFRPESNVLVKLKGKLVAAFQSDAKTLVTDRGNRAANLFRFSYPDNENNLCRDWEDCKNNKTFLWNEIVVKPIFIVDYKIVNKY